MKFNGQWLNPGMEKEYRKVCSEIAASDLTDFKRNPVYIKYIGNDVRPYETAKAFYDHLLLYLYADKNRINEISLHNDRIGNPLKYKLNDFLKYSPGTLRFIKVLYDLIKFKMFTSYNIIEIGSGYGGQALCTKILRPNSNYYLVDIEESLAIAKKYLSNFPQYEFNFINADEKLKLRSGGYGLVISDYCISELNKTGCDFYLQNIVAISYNCYLTINDKSPRKQQIIDFLNNNYQSVSIFAERPKTSRHDNLILIGKNLRK